MKKNIILLLYIILLIACSSSKEQYTIDDAVRLSKQIDYFVYLYSESKDTAMLMKALSFADIGVQNMEQFNCFSERKFWILLSLKRYDEAITLLDTYYDEYKYNIPFGKIYYYQLCNILKYHHQGITDVRNQHIQELIEYMDLAFAVGQNAKSGIPINESISNKIEEWNTDFPAVSPTSYSALIAYYRIRVMLEDRNKLIGEMKHISIDEDFEEEDLKKDLIANIKNVDMLNN